MVQFFYTRNVNQLAEIMKVISPGLVSFKTFQLIPLDVSWLDQVYIALKTNFSLQFKLS